MEALAHTRASPDPLDAESPIVSLARSGAPLRRALSAIAGRLVATRAFERLGFARLGDYAVERAGLSARQLQDLARVDRALAGLPRIESAFVAGRLTWTKTRLLCRAATAGDEERWLEVAGRTTARALAREVRAVDARALEAGGIERDEDGAETAPRETVWLKLTPRVRARWSRAQLLACREVGETLSKASVAEWVAAEVMSALPLEVDPGPTTPLSSKGANGCATQGPLQEAAGRPARPEAPTLTPEAAAASANGCATHGPASLPRFLAALVEGLDSADAFELDARLRRALRLEQRLLAEMAPLLLEVARSRSYRAYGCPSLAAFAREWLGMSPRKAQMLLRLERACTLAPPLREAFRSARLSWLQVHALVPIVALDHAEPWRSAWVAHAERVSVQRLGEDVEKAIATGVLDPESTAAVELDEVQTGAPPTASEETVTFFFTAPTDVARLFRAVLATVQRRVERANGRTASASEALDAMLAHCLETWAVPGQKVPREHQVFARDEWRCTVPGCTSRRNLHAHHIRFRSAGGSDALANQTTLCAWHHLRGVHAGIVRIRGRAPGALRFELGVRPPQPPLVAYATGGVRLPVG